MLSASQLAACHNTGCLVLRGFKRAVPEIAVNAAGRALAEADEPTPASCPRPRTT